MDHKKEFFFFITLLSCAIFLRFYKLSEWFFFNIDEEWFLYIVRKIVEFHRPVLVGWEMPGGILTTPIMYYIGAFLMLVSRNNPLSLAINSALVSTATAGLIYVIGKHIFEKKVAVIASVIFCASYLVNIFIRVTLTVYLGPLLSLLTYYSLYRIVNKKEFKWFYLLSFVFILSTQEGSLFSLPILSAFFIYKNRSRIPIHTFTIPLIIFLTSFAPLFVFDIRHDFLASRRIINFLSPKKQDSIKPPASKAVFSNYNLFGRSLTRILITSGPNDLGKQILPCIKYESQRKETGSFFPGAIGFLAIFYFLLRPKLKNGKYFGNRLVATHLSIVIVGLTIYSFLMPSSQHEWFFALLFPAYSYIAATIFTDLTSVSRLLKSLALFIVATFLIHNISRTISGSSENGYQEKLQASTFIRNELSGKTYDLEFLGDGCNAYGYRYLLTYLQFEPNHSYMDNNYGGWLYNVREPKKSNFKAFITPLDDIVSPEENSRFAELRSKKIKSYKNNQIEVLITR